MTDRSNDNQIGKGVGPFEDLGDDQVVTFPCPQCDALHNREQYMEIREERRVSAVVKIYRCPNGHEVELDMQVMVSDNLEDAVYVELHPK